MAARSIKKNQQSPTVTATAAKRLQAVAGYVSDPDASGSARLLHDRIRIGIMSALSVNRSMSFSELKELLGTTDGNLSKHARRLEDAGYLSCKKQFSNRVPKTEFALTTKGKKMFARHLEHMESLIQATRHE